MPGKRASEAERREQILRGALRVALRDRLDSLAMRNVAAEAGVSHGLVFFHFKSKEALLIELLRWMLSKTFEVVVPPPSLHGATPAAQLLELLQQQLQRLEERPGYLELFFDFWVLGSRNPTMRELICNAFDSYGSAFVPLVQAVIEQDRERFADTDAEGLVLLVVSLIQGYALQTIKDPQHRTTGPMLAAIYALIGYKSSAPILEANASLSAA